MPAAPTTRRRVELVLIPLVAAFCMAFIIGAIVLDRDGGSCPAPNWNNHLSLSLAGNQSSNSTATAVTACSGTDCVPQSPTFAKMSAGGTRMLTHQKDGSWMLTVGALPPKTLNFSVYDQNG
ncbi:hypothetical protein, partial [Arthrobacter sp.]|uniref:hypothetical protein n=1 Tax=Arthrobacter sp. TaxID=1667 RepID=UPI0026E018EA